MGQYYKACVEGIDNKVFAISPWTYDNGAKLMEHSWMYNDYVNAVLSLIYNNPQRVAWIGDYSDDRFGDPYESKVSVDEFMRFYNTAWGDEEQRTMIAPEINKALYGRIKKMFLVDHDSGQYVDVAEYIKRCTTNEGWCVNPLPLLTACGNDRGGGDFHKCNVGYDSVGLWAFDRIEITENRPPENYVSVDYTFIEEW